MDNTVDTSTQPQDDLDESRQRIIGRIATVTATVTAAALGPGLALAEAALSKNHNEVMATTRR